MKYLVELINSCNFENKESEFKLKLESEQDKIEKWAKSLVGFANINGGLLFVGVTDDGIAIGINKKEIDLTKNLVLQTINRYIFPHINVEFAIYQCEPEKFILSILVNSANEIVVYKTGDYNEKVYIREDGATIPANVNQILMMGKRINGTDNHIIREQFEMKNFTLFYKLAKLYRKDNKEITKEMLINNEIIRQDGLITSGLKMFSDNYNNDDTLVVCRLWNGDNKGIDEVLDKKEFYGSLSKTFLDVLEFVKRNSRSGFIKNQDGSRLNTSSYPEQALKEALVNAFAHRDYSISGTQIDIDIFKDRLEINSPGKWLLLKEPNEYDLDKIPSIRRNKIICNCFEILGLMEKAGSGFKKIYTTYNNANGKMPILYNVDDFFSITLFDLLCEERKIEFIGKFDEQILEFCKNNARSREEIQSYIGYSSRSHFMQDVLKPLIDSKKLMLTAPAKSKNVKYISKK